MRDGHVQKRRRGALSAGSGGLAARVGPVGATARFHPNARLWLVAAALIGTGQQIFVVLRNQYLLDLGLSAGTITSVQGAGGAAGIAAGLLGLWAVRRIPSRAALGLGAVANAGGFAIQVTATSPEWLIAGSALAGLGIQGLTMVAAPFLARYSTAGQRARLFATNAIAIHALPGAIGALIAGEAQHAARRALHSPLLGYRFALALGCAAVALALLPLRRLHESPREAAQTSWRALFHLHQPSRVAVLLVPDLVVFFGSGLTVPFLQLYFKQRFGLAPASTGALYAVMMLAGCAGHLFSPRLARRFGTWPVIVGAQIASLPFYAVLLITGFLPVAAIAFVFRQAVMNTSTPLTGAFLHSNVLDDDSGPLASYRMLAQSVVWTAANFLAGTLIALDAGGYRFLIGATIASYVAGIISGLLLYPRLVVIET